MAGFLAVGGRQRFFQRYYICNNPVFLKKPGAREPQW
jgi:hypothetical protein